MLMVNKDKDNSLYGNWKGRFSTTHSGETTEPILIKLDI